MDVFKSPGSERGPVPSLTLCRVKFTGASDLRIQRELEPAPHGEIAPGSQGQGGSVSYQDLPSWSQGQQHAPAVFEELVPRSQGQGWQPACQGFEHQGAQPIYGNITGFSGQGGPASYGTSAEGFEGQSGPASRLEVQGQLAVFGQTASGFQGQGGVENYGEVAPGFPGQGGPPAHGELPSMLQSQAGLASRGEIGGFQGQGGLGSSENVPGLQSYGRAPVYRTFSPGFEGHGGLMASGEVQASYGYGPCFPGQVRPVFNEDLAQFQGQGVGSFRYNAAWLQGHGGPGLYGAFPLQGWMETSSSGEFHRQRVPLSHGELALGFQEEAEDDRISRFLIEGQEPDVSGAEASWSGHGQQR